MNKKQELILKQRVMQLAQQKKYSEAKDIALTIVRALPKDIEVWFALAQLQEHEGEFEAAVRSYYQVCQGPSPRYADAIEKSVVLCWKHRLLSLGVSPAQELIKLKPTSPDAYFYLGYFWFESMHYLTAEPYLLKALELAPDNAFLQCYCGQLYTAIALPEEAIPYYERAQKLKPNDIETFTSGIMSYNYADTISEEVVYRAHRSFGEKLEEKYSSLEGVSDLPAGRPERLKVAYISADFKYHSVAYFFKAIIESYSSEKFEVICYSDVDKPDEMTECFKGLSDFWVDSCGMTDEELYLQIREDGVDIVVDLAGYSGATRLDVFARKAAPVQVSYLGYPNTTGLSRMDFRVTDNWSDPESVACLYSESLKYLPGGFLCFTPVNDAPEVSFLPALHRDSERVCFGSFNAFQKLPVRLLKVWARVLLAVPNSFLYIKAKPLNEKALCERVVRIFEDQGVSRDRLELVGWTSDAGSHLGAYSKIDIHLDSYPYNGTTTICEALWQGVPVITLSGESHRSRVGLSLLSQLGLESFVASSEQEYIDIAVMKASDLASLSELRKGMRDRMRSSTLMDRSRFISELEAAYEQMWVEKILN